MQKTSCSAEKAPISEVPPGVIDTVKELLQFYVQSVLIDTNQL
jgi:hypothetical protein